MDTERLLALCDRLRWVRLRIRIRMGGAGQFDHQAGALLHGALGWAMRDAAPHLWLPAYAPLEQGAARPLTWHPPELPCQWQAGDEVVLGLSLYGDLTTDLPGLLTALIVMGERGLGAARTSFMLTEVVQHTQIGQRLLWSGRQPAQRLLPLATGLSDALLGSMALCEGEALRLAQIRTLTRLHIKDQGRVIRAAPSALLFARTVCRRLLTLLVNTLESDKQVLYDHLNGLEHLTLLWDHTHHAPLHRYSARQRQHHDIEGLAGSWAYHGDVIRLLPWLVLAQWIQLGNKTSFGYGSIEWQLGAEDVPNQLATSANMPAYVNNSAQAN